MDKYSNEKLQSDEVAVEALEERREGKVDYIGAAIRAIIEKKMTHDEKNGFELDPSFFRQTQENDSTPDSRAFATTADDEDFRRKTEAMVNRILGDSTQADELFKLYQVAYQIFRDLPDYMDPDQIGLKQNKHGLLKVWDIENKGKGKNYNVDGEGNRILRMEKTAKDQKWPAKPVCKIDLNNTDLWPEEMTDDDKEEVLKLIMEFMELSKEEQGDRLTREAKMINRMLKKDTMVAELKEILGPQVLSLQEYLMFFKDLCGKGKIPERVNPDFLTRAYHGAYLFARQLHAEVTNEEEAARMEAIYRDLFTELNTNGFELCENRHKLVSELIKKVEQELTTSHLYTVERTGSHDVYDLVEMCIAENKLEETDPELEEELLDLLSLRTKYRDSAVKFEVTMNPEIKAELKKDTEKAQAELIQKLEEAIKKDNLPERIKNMLINELCTHALANVGRSKDKAEKTKLQAPRKEAEKELSEAIDLLTTVAKHHRILRSDDQFQESKRKLTKLGKQVDDEFIKVQDVTKGIPAKMWGQLSELHGIEFMKKFHELFETRIGFQGFQLKELPIAYEENEDLAHIAKVTTGRGSTYHTRLGYKSEYDTFSKPCVFITTGVPMGVNLSPKKQKAFIERLKETSGMNVKRLGLTRILDCAASASISGIDPQNCPIKARLLLNDPFQGPGNTSWITTCKSDEHDEKTMVKGLSFGASKEDPPHKTKPNLGVAMAMNYKSLEI